MASYKLTQYSKASGCGCKLAPHELDVILKKSDIHINPFSNLLVGSKTKDDAAVYKINDTECIVSTVDFFTPIVNEAFDFGRIAACNAISDIYAMGAKPLMATAILGWPSSIIPLEEAQKVINGAVAICSKAHIPLAGGHSIKSLEPIFGLSVTGIINTINIKKNNSVQKDDILFITKPLGIGILSAALKRDLLNDEDYKTLLTTTIELNRIGMQLGKLPYVSAMTDITGFGFLGHLLEMLDNTSFSAVIKKADIPIIKQAQQLASQFIYPDNTTRNYNAIVNEITGLEGLDFITLCDPQTSGGLLFSVNATYKTTVEELLQKEKQFYKIVGHIVPKQDKRICLG